MTPKVRHRLLALWGLCIPCALLLEILKVSW